MDACEARALEIASEHYGIVSRGEALRAGMSARRIDRRIASGRWLSVHPGVYRVNGVPVTGRQRAYAACTWLGPGALVSHSVAGALLRLDRVRPSGLDVTVPPTVRRGQRSGEITVHRSRTLARHDACVVDGIPCTSATRTILDLAAVLDAEALECAFESARRQRLTSPVTLARRFEETGGRGRPGSARLRRLLDVTESRPLESPLEIKLARLLRTSALPIPVRQLAVARHRVDFAWPAAQLVVECDGFEHHGDRLAWKRDRRRIATLEASGWRVMIVTWDDVTRHPGETLDRLAGALALAA